MKYKNPVIMAVFLAVIAVALTWSSYINAVDNHLRINVTPGNITFNITNPDPLPQFYNSSQQVSVVTRQTMHGQVKQWFVGIRAGGAYLVDDINPTNRIPVSKLRWSKDGN